MLTDRRRPPGRGRSLCKNLEYFGSVDTRRRKAGRRLARARRAAGYRSQKAFAAAINVSEASVANAERGAETVGEGVFTLVETGLNMPDEIITRYLETGDPDLLELIAFYPTSPRRPPEPEPELRDRVERDLWAMKHIPVRERLALIEEHRRQAG